MDESQNAKTGEKSDKTKKNEKQSPSTFKNKVQIIIEGIDKTDKIRTFDESDDKINIIFFSNDTVYKYSKDKVQIKHSSLSNDTTLKRFEYLKSIVQPSKLQESQNDDFLAKQYEKISFLSEENMLSVFLTGKLNKMKPSNTTVAVYPFGFNMSQKAAVDNALKNKLSIVEGPPGTGKTQTILNIIANAVMRDESVAVVSNNNSAIENVLGRVHTT